MTNIAENLTVLKKRVAEAAVKARRTPNSVTLLAASKAQDISKIREAAHAGQKRFGENYLQEALSKIEALQTLQLEWHYIGRIQANKTKAIAEHFSWVHSVDRVKVAQRLNDQRPAELGCLNVCIEVNVSGEANKSGISPSELEALATALIAMPRLQLRGLMVIPELTTDFSQQLETYQRVAVLQQQLNAKGFNLDTLSMGMSHDFEAAIAAGSTIVRIGTALFGPRL